MHRDASAMQRNVALVPDTASVGDSEGRLTSNDSAIGSAKWSAAEPTMSRKRVIAVFKKFKVATDLRSYNTHPFVVHIDEFVSTRADGYRRREYFARHWKSIRRGGAITSRLRDERGAIRRDGFIRSKLVAELARRSYRAINGELKLSR